MTTPAILALQDGTVFHGTSIGAPGQTIGEVVFNTAMTGYQEILTDPSYCRQLVTLTYPHIGNTGSNSEDMETSKIHASGLIVRDSSMVTSSWRAERPFRRFLEQGDTVAIADIDTRKLTRHIRENGAMSGCIMSGEQDPDLAVEHARKFPGIAGMDLASVVTTERAYQWCHGSSFGRPARVMSRRVAPYHVVAYDFGIKRNILHILSDLDCRMTVVPAKTPAKEALDLAPDGIFLSNGPGDPAATGEYAVPEIKQLVASGKPVFEGATFKGYRGVASEITRPITTITTSRLQPPVTSGLTQAPSRRLIIAMETTVQTATAPKTSSDLLSPFISRCAIAHNNTPVS